MVLKKQGHHQVDCNDGVAYYAMEDELLGSVSK